MSSNKKAKPEPAEKDKKTKLVRDSFTIPKGEYAALEQLKVRALGCGVAIKKSELLRAGLMALSAMPETGFKIALAAVPTLKTGRPTQQDKETKPAAKTTAPVVAPKTQAAPARKTPATAKPPAQKAAAKTRATTTATPTTAKRGRSATS